MKETKYAILFAVLAAFGFAIQDAVVKLLTQIGSIWQLMLVRSFFVVSILLLWAIISKQLFQLLPNAWQWPVLRAFCMSIAYTCFYASLPFAALSEASACFFTAPIFVCLFAKLFLKESIGIWRLTAIISGFIGAIIIIQPGFSNFRPILVLPVMAGAVYAVGVIITRGKCRNEPSFSLTIVHNIFYTCLGAFAITFIPLIQFDYYTVAKNAFLLQGWVPLSQSIIFLIGITSLTHIVAFTASIRAYQTVETTIIVPIEYSYLLFAAIIDYFFWHFVPSLTHIIGAFFILGSGLTISWREWNSRTICQKNY